MALSKNEPTVVRNLQGSLQVESEVLQVPESWQHMIFIPVAYRNQLVGFLLVAGGGEQQYSLDDELTLLKILAT
jgi:GAF domain-containing protein